jgi:hypothetical protein
LQPALKFGPSLAELFEECRMSLTFGFELLREQALPEINSMGRLYRHAKTGAELLSLINDDENKVFGIAFRTPPADSSGVAHILEHSVLCGSRKYPVKDPFVQLMKGSLHTFLNAMTFSDKTVYPVASQNLRCLSRRGVLSSHQPAYHGARGLALRARSARRSSHLQGRRL